MSEPPDSIDWGCCGADAENNDYVLCSICYKGYHLDCMASTGTVINAGQEVLPDWVCPLCSNQSRGRNSDNTPLRSVKNTKTRPHKRAALNSPPKADSGLTRDDVRDVVQELFTKEMDNLFIRLGQQIRSTIAAELAPIKKDILELRASIDFTRERCEVVIKEQSCITDEIKDIHAENASLRLENMNLTSKLNQLEQYARGNNIEIQCVPEKNNENVVTIVKKISNIIDCDINDENISRCSRIAKINPKSARPRSIVVQFNSPRVRDTFLASSIKFNKSNPNNRLNSSHIGLTGEKTSIFVVEHLSASNKALHSSARSAAKDKGYKFVWVRNGRIYMRKTETSDYKIIKNLDSLNNLE